MELQTIDISDPRTAINLLPKEMGENIENAARLRPDLFGRGESELYAALKSEALLPDASDSRIRMQFWLEYDSAMEEGRKMVVGKIYAGVLHRGYFYEKWVKVPTKIAWMMTRPTDYVTKVREARDFGMDRMRDYLSLDPKVFAPTNIGAQLRLMEFQAKLTAMLDNRDKGAVTSRSAPPSWPPGWSTSSGGRRSLRSGPRSR